jgi:repressor LexA
MNRRLPYQKNQKNQVRLLKYIWEHIETFGYPPSIRECSVALRFKSTNHTRFLLGVLISEGYLTTHYRIARGMRLEEKGKQFCRDFGGGEVVGQPI